MTLFSKLLGIDAAIIVIGAVLFVVFGETTVRKLRKNPKTKDSLGVVFFSGWEIINAATALSLPKCLIRRLKRSPFSMCYADADLLKQHTTVFDKVLARMFFWLGVFFAITMIVLLMLNEIGVLK